MVLDDADIRDEGELESLLKKDPEQIEKGLIVLDNQIRTPPTDNRIDLLCVDSEGTLTIVELKQDSDEHQMEQIMMYYDWALSNLDWIKNAYKKKLHKEIKNESPRLILIAKNFPHKVITLSKYINEKISRISLYTYKAVKIDDKKEIICNDFPIPKVPELYEKPKTPEDIINIIKDEKVKKECNKLRDYIINIDSDNIDETATKSTTTFKYKGKNICEISPRKDYFWLGWRQIDGEWKNQGNITTFDEAVKIVDEGGNIRDFYQNLKQSK